MSPTFFLGVEVSFELKELVAMSFSTNYNQNQRILLQYYQISYTTYIAWAKHYTFLVIEEVLYMWSRVSRVQNNSLINIDIDSYELWLNHEVPKSLIVLLFMFFTIFYKTNWNNQYHSWSENSSRNCRILILSFVVRSGTSPVNLFLICALSLFGSSAITCRL